jgi:SAM-dependent methyltransferase
VPLKGRSTTADIDLDHLSETYRFRPMRPEGEARVRKALAGLPPGTAILDIGGGVGAHAAFMARQGHWPVVVDPSTAQRHKASQLGLAVVAGVSQSLPFRDASFDMAYFHLSLHYGDWVTALDEAGRVVREGGRIWVWTFASHYLEHSFTGRWFPSVRRHDLRRFPPVSDIAARLASIGVFDVTAAEAPEEVARTVASWEEAFRARFVSTLQLIDEPELAGGLRAFRREFPDRDRVVSVTLEFVSVSGRVGG